VQVQRDATAFLGRSMDFSPPDDAAVASRRINKNMALLHQCWPADFGEKLREHFPSEAAAEQAKDFLAKVVAARYYGAGNCGEHARVVADARAAADDALRSLTRASEGVWREKSESEDVSQAAYSRVPPNLRGDFLGEARRRAASWPEQSLFIELAGVVRSMGKPVAAATSLEVAGPVLQAFDQLLNQPTYGTLGPDVRLAVEPEPRPAYPCAAEERRPEL
jgi:hypothetical protein